MCSSVRHLIRDTERNICCYNYEQLYSEKSLEHIGWIFTQYCYTYACMCDLAQIHSFWGEITWKWRMTMGFAFTLHSIDSIKCDTPLRHTLSNSFQSRQLYYYTYGRTYPHLLHTKSKLLINACMQFMFNTRKATGAKYMPDQNCGHTHAIHRDGCRTSVEAPEAKPNFYSAIFPHEYEVMMTASEIKRKNQVFYIPCRRWRCYVCSTFELTIWSLVRISRSNRLLLGIE